MAYLRIIYIDIIINYTVYYRLNFPFAFESDRTVGQQDR